VREPTAKSLTLDLLSTLRGGSLPVSALVAAAELFGIAENSVRVAVARLLAARVIARDERGRYRLGSAAEPVERQVRSWRRREARTRRWDGGWVGIHLGDLAAPKKPARVQRERALEMLGFEAFTAGLRLRPDNLRGALPGLREELHKLGLESSAVVFRITKLDPADDARARGLWDVGALRSGYASSRLDLEESAASLDALPEADAMVESFLLGGRVLRQLVLDPLLPEPIVPVAERQALVDAMGRYDRLGRQAWAAFMGRHDAPRLDAPVHGSAPGTPLLH
jgi:phenylacetic acid degradation operon negative regulatory protein